MLAFKSMQRRGVSRLQLLRKITWRTVVLLMLGFCFLNYSPRDGPCRCKICSPWLLMERVHYMWMFLFCTGEEIETDASMSNYKHVQMQENRKSLFLWWSFPHLKNVALTVYDVTLSTLDWFCSKVISRSTSICNNWSIDIQLIGNYFDNKLKVQS